MTCIVGIVHREGVIIGGDSAGVTTYRIVRRADEKVFQVGEFIMGFTDSFRMGQILRYSFVPPARGAEDDLTFMNTKFIDAVRQCLKSGGYARKSDEVESGGTFLVGYKGKLYCVESDYQVGISLEEFEAIGCGEEFALGCLHATPGQDPRARAQMALEAAARFSTGVRGPFNFVEQAKPCP